MKKIKKFTALLVIFAFVCSLFMVDISSQKVEASKASQYVVLNKNVRIKVGGYYYWIEQKSEITFTGRPEFKSSSFKILRSKTEKGKGTVIYKTSGTFKYKEGKDTWSAPKYDYIDVLTNGKYVVFGEEDGVTEKITYYRIGVNGKGKKKIAVFDNPWYYPDSASKFSCSGILGVNGDNLFCHTPDMKKSGKGNGDFAMTYKISIKTGKKTRMKAGDDYGGSIGIRYFDGRYVYNSYAKKGKYAFDCKTGKTVKTKKMVAYCYGTDGNVYGIKVKNTEKDDMECVKVNIYHMKNNKETELLNQTFEKVKNLNGLVVTEKFMYFRFRTSDESGYFKYNRKTQEITAITEKQYDKFRNMEKWIVY